MHGHARVELRDADTGRLEDVREEDNIVTDAVKDVVSLLACNSYNSANMHVPFATNLLGGLALFDEELAEDKSNVRWPTDAHLVAMAGSGTNSSDAMLGSQNSTETGPITGGYRTVWDFSTSQANGRIKSLARTNVFDVSGSQNNMFVESFRNISYPVYVDDTGYYRLSDTNVRLFRNHPRGPIGVYESWGTTSGETVIPESDIQPSFKLRGVDYEHEGDPSLVDNMDGSMLSYSNTNMRYTNSTGGTGSTDFTDLVAYRYISMKDGEWKSGDTKTVSWSISNAPSGISPKVRMCDGYVWVIYDYNSSLNSNGPTIYRFSLDNPAAVSMADLSGLSLGKNGCRGAAPLRGGCLAFSYGYLGYSYAIVASDLKAYRVPTCRRLHEYVQSGVPLMLSEQTSGDNPAIDGLYLGTINNIGEIDKTPSQTMKVIYDLTDE